MSNEFEDVTEDEGIISLTYSNNLYSIFLDEDIGDPEKYRKIFNLLQKVSNRDTIKIIFNTCGGNAFTSVYLFNAILNCPAFIIGDIYVAYSAGAHIALACDELLVNPFSSMMFHSLSWGTSGKVHEMKSHTDFACDWDTKTNLKSYETFLTKKEIKSLIKGEDIWIKDIDITKRIKTWKPLKQRIAEGEKLI